MSSSTPSLKFLLDENVHHALYKLLKEKKKLDVVLASKSASDRKLAEISKAEKRIFVTNDEDFTDYSKDDIFSVVWLRIAQNDPDTLQKTFENLLSNILDFEGKLIILYPKSLDTFQLGEDIEAPHL